MQRYQWLIITLSLALNLSASSLAKGLDEISGGNPEPEPKSEAAGEDSSGEVAAEKSALSQAIANKLYLATSFGWVKATASEGTWNDGKVVGMSDITVGYVIPMSVAGFDLYGTYRYAPVAVAGDVDNHSFRGVWEYHYFGATGRYAISDGLRAIATAELGYVLVYYNSLDNIPSDADTEDNGFAVALGGGADWDVLDDPKFTVGPRLTLAFGSFTTIQVSGSFSYVF